MSIILSLTILFEKIVVGVHNLIANDHNFVPTEALFRRTAADVSGTIVDADNQLSRCVVNLELMNPFSMSVITKFDAATASRGRGLKNPSIKVLLHFFIPFFLLNFLL